jgi:chorismate mutase
MTKLDLYRKQINKIDKKIVKDLIKRYDIVKNIDIYKKQNNIPVTNTNREQIVLDAVRSMAIKNLTPDMAEAIFKEIIKQAKVLQNNK